MKAPGSRHPRPPLPGGPYLVLGLARSGQAAARALRALGEEVIGVDDGAPAGARELTSAGVRLHLESDGAGLQDAARTLVESPGVPHDAPLARAARAAGMDVIGELELAWRLLPNTFVAVTGTNGKTTTVELLAHILREAARPVAVAGNVGTPASSLIGSLDPAAAIVCEASSFQLEDTIMFAPDVAVVLNVTADHLDRHGTMEEYVEAKRQAFARQGDDDLAVVPTGAAGEHLGGGARRVRFGDGGDITVREGRVLWRGQELIEAADVSLRGAHNLLNAMAAAATALELSVAPAAVRSALASFPGVPHRLEEVARIRGVLYVNDSKATNIASTLVALEAFEPGTVNLILGGRCKGQDFAALRDAVEHAARRVLLIGEDAPRVGAALRGIRPRVTQCGDLERALAAVRRGVRRGDVVLLSPACASYDQFADFEQRGERFRELVLSGA